MGTKCLGRLGLSCPRRRLELGGWYRDMVVSTYQCPVRRWWWGDEWTGPYYRLAVLKFRECIGYLSCTGARRQVGQKSSSTSPTRSTDASGLDGAKRQLLLTRCVDDRGKTRVSARFTCRIFKGTRGLVWGSGQWNCTVATGAVPFANCILHGLAYALLASSLRSTSVYDALTRFSFLPPCTSVFD